MTTQQFLVALGLRASAAGVVVSHELAERLASYFEILARWNRTVNLTGFELDSPTDAAIDRLFIEPLLVARAIHQSPEAMIDIGSGGGSPGIPLSLALSPFRTVLVEARTKKGVFLKEVVRRMGLSTRIEVSIARFEDLTTNKLAVDFDLLTVRAVRISDEDLLAMSSFLKPTGHLVVFGRGEGLSAPGVFASSEVRVPLGTTGSALVLTRA